CSSPSTPEQKTELNRIIVPIDNDQLSTGVGPQELPAVPGQLSPPVRGLLGLNRCLATPIWTIAADPRRVRSKKPRWSGAVGTFILQVQPLWPFLRRSFRLVYWLRSGADR